MITPTYSVSWVDDEKHSNHRSEYYYNIYGGEPGKDYSAELVIAPPQDFRGDGQTFKYYNLDYFFLTSELASLKDKPYIVDVIIGNSKNVYYLDSREEREQDPENIDWSLLTDLILGDPDILNLYEVYSDNTIGAIEQKIKSESNGEFDAIRPYFTNGVPDYRFVNNEEIEKTRTQTLSPLYRPIIVSEEWYDQLRRNGEYRRSEFIIDLKKAIGNWYYTDETSGVYIAKYLAAGLRPTILLSNKGFEYPIYYITIGHKYIYPSDYEVKNGWLYLSPSIPLDNPDTFDLHIYFDTIVKGNPGTPDTNDETGRYALAQTLSYSISDYFNQYYIAATDAKKKAELEFTRDTTIWSTLFSTLILLPVTAVTMAIIKTFTTMGRKEPMTLRWTPTHT